MQVTIGFFWTAGGCVELPTLRMDMFVDVFFLCEIAYTFFVGVVEQGRYRDELGFVAKVGVPSQSAGPARLQDIVEAME